jgi:hypothetical protein
VSQHSDDLPTGPIQARPAPPRQTPHAGLIRPQPRPARRWRIVADATAVVLLVAAVFLPWNLYFGLGIPGSDSTIFVALLAVTLLSLVSVAVAGYWRSPESGRLRLALNVPYLLLVLAFVGFDVFETVHFGGTVNLPGGVGPGAWLGVAGALLSAQAIGPAPEEHKFTSARIIGIASIAVATLSFAFNLYWRVRYALQTNGAAADFGKQNIAVLVTSVVYGVAALVAVVVASRWLLAGSRASRLATVALGASTVVAGVVVWLLPAGRDIDAFHGIAQNTSTAGVGFEGFLAWAAAAAIFAPRTLLGHHQPSAAEESAWRVAARQGLLLIAVWCLGSMAMRLTDLGVAVTLDYPFSRYDSIVLAVFDLITAGLAIWLRIRLGGKPVSPRLVSSLCGLIATLTVARVVVGVELAPRFAESPTSPSLHPVYGNDLAQQITSVFDVALCGLGLSIFAFAIVTGQLRGRRLRLQRRRAARKRVAPPPGQPPSPGGRTRVRVGPSPTPPAVPSAQETTRIRTGQGGPAPRIFRGDDSATRQIPVRQPKIFRPPQP